MVRSSKTASYAWTSPKAVGAIAMADEAEDVEVQGAEVAAVGEAVGDSTTGEKAEDSKAVKTVMLSLMIQFRTVKCSWQGTVTEAAAGVAAAALKIAEAEAATAVVVVAAAVVTKIAAASGTVHEEKVAEEAMAGNTATSE
jgi:trans-2-enoyl-CoA reductase